MNIQHGILNTIDPFSLKPRVKFNKNISMFKILITHIILLFVEYCKMECSFIMFNADFMLIFGKGDSL